MSLRYQPIEVILTLEQLSELCAEWQERLRLQDWMVYLRVARQHEIPNCAGHCEYFNTQKTARIAIVDHLDWTEEDDRWRPQDMEETLVHEMLHLQHSHHTYEKGTPEYEAWEVAIDTTAQALVQLKRERIKEETKEEAQA